MKPIADVVEPAQALPELFTHAQADLAGLRPERPHGRPITRITRDVYTLRQPVDYPLRVRAACLALGSDSIVHGVTALRLRGVDLPRRLQEDERVHVLRTKRTFPAMRDDICSHRDRLQVGPEALGGLWVTTAAEAWLQIANQVSIDALVHVGDALMRREHALSRLSDLTALVEHSHRRPGIRKARAALLLCREGTDSWPETTVRLLLVRGGLPCPTVNLPITDETGRIVYYLDMAYPAQRVAVEYDGRYHVDDATRVRDLSRRRWLEDRSWRLVSVAAPDLRDPAGIVASVRLALSSDARS